MFCMYCGKELPNEARFCLYCGKELTIRYIDDNQENTAQKEISVGGDELVQEYHSAYNSKSYLIAGKTLELPYMRLVIQ